jgi:hypothetical protein
VIKKRKLIQLSDKQPFNPYIVRRLPEGAEVQIELADGAEPTTNKPGEPTIWQKLADLGRWAETLPTDLPEDLAINHDHYLHGTPKRQ